MDTTTQAAVKAALKQLAGRQESYRLFADYYGGRHRLCFATERFRNAFGGLFRKFADNIMPAVIDAVRDKLQVTGFNVEDGADLSDQAWEIWQRNRMHRQAGEVHIEALRSGDAYVMVWPGADGKARIYPQKASLCTVSYDPEEPGKIVSAFKVWMNPEQKVRLNVYFADRIEKYITRSAHPNGLPDGAKAFVEFAVDGEPWPFFINYTATPEIHIPTILSILPSVASASRQRLT